MKSKANLRSKTCGEPCRTIERVGTGGSSDQVNTGMSLEATGNRKKSTMFGIAFCTLLFALCVSVEAQQPRKVLRIGYLDPSNASATAAPDIEVRFHGRPPGAAPLGEFL